MSQVIIITDYRIELEEIAFEKKMVNETGIKKEEITGQCSEWRIIQCILKLSSILFNAETYHEKRVHIKTSGLQFVPNRNKTLKDIRFEWAWCLVHLGYSSYLLNQSVKTMPVNKEVVVQPSCEQVCSKNNQHCLQNGRWSYLNHDRDPQVYIYLFIKIALTLSFSLITTLHC